MSVLIQLEQEEQQIISFDSVARGLASGEPFALDVVKSALSTSGKTVQQLKDRIAGYHVYRAGLREQVAAGERAIAERNEILRQQAAADLELRAATERHQQISWANTAQLQALDSIERDACEARRRLIDGCDNQEILQGLENCKYRLSTLDYSIRAALESVAKIEAEVSREQSAKKPGADNFWLTEAESRGGDGRRIAALQARLEKAQAELRKLYDEQNALLQQQRDLIEQKLTD